MKKIVLFVFGLSLTACTTSTYYSYNVNVDKAGEKINRVENDPSWVLKASDPLYHMAYPNDFSILMYSDDYEYADDKNKSTKIVVAPYMHMYKMHGLTCYRGVQVYYKDKKIGEVKDNSYNCSQDRTNHLKHTIPQVALCASRIGFHGNLGGEKAKEGEKSPSMVEFFKQCKMDY